MAGMPRRLFLTHVAALPFGCLSVPSALALENAAAAASAPSPVPAVRPGGFVDHEGWILPVGDRDAIIAARRAGCPPPGSWSVGPAAPIPLDADLAGTNGSSSASPDIRGETKCAHA